MKKLVAILIATAMLISMTVTVSGLSVAVYHNLDEIMQGMSSDGSQKTVLVVTGIGIGVETTTVYTFCEFNGDDSEHLIEIASVRVTEVLYGNAQAGDVIKVARARYNLNRPRDNSLDVFYLPEIYFPEEEQEYLLFLMDIDPMQWLGEGFSELLENRYQIGHHQRIQKIDSEGNFLRFDILAESVEEVRQFFATESAVEPNPNTSVTFSVIPIALAGIAVLASRRRI
jgi:hypothetical protein